MKEVKDLNGAYATQADTIRNKNDKIWIFMWSIHLLADNDLECKDVDAARLSGFKARGTSKAYF